MLMMPGSDRTLGSEELGVIYVVSIVIGDHVALFSGCHNTG